MGVGLRNDVLLFFVYEECSLAPGIFESLQLRILHTTCQIPNLTPASTGVVRPPKIWRLLLVIQLVLEVAAHEEARKLGLCV